MLASSWPMKAPKHTVATASHHAWGHSRTRAGLARSLVSALSIVDGLRSGRRHRGGNWLGCAATVLKEEEDHGGHEDDQAGPVVEPQTEEVVGVVDAQRLDPGTPDGVRGDVQREEPSVAQPEPAPGPHQEHGHADVPDRLVQEGRVVEPDARGRGGPVRGIDLQGPGQGGWAAVELLVEE